MDRAARRSASSSGTSAVDAMPDFHRLPLLWKELLHNPEVSHFRDLIRFITGNPAQYPWPISPIVALPVVDESRKGWVVNFGLSYWDRSPNQTEKSRRRVILSLKALWSSGCGRMEEIRRSSCLNMAGSLVKRFLNQAQDKKSKGHDAQFWGFRSSEIESPSRQLLAALCSQLGLPTPVYYQCGSVDSLHWPILWRCDHPLLRRQPKFRMICRYSIADVAQEVLTRFRDSLEDAALIDHPHHDHDRKESSGRRTLPFHLMHLLRELIHLNPDDLSGFERWLATLIEPVAEGTGRAKAHDVKIGLSCSPIAGKKAPASLWVIILMTTSNHSLPTLRACASLQTYSQSSHVRLLDILSKLNVKVYFWSLFQRSPLSPIIPVLSVLRRHYPIIPPSEQSVPSLWRLTFPGVPSQIGSSSQSPEPGLPGVKIILQQYLGLSPRDWKAIQDIRCHYTYRKRYCLRRDHSHHLTFDAKHPEQLVFLWGTSKSEAGKAHHMQTQLLFETVLEALASLHLGPVFGSWFHRG